MFPENNKQLKDKRGKLLQVKHIMNRGKFPARFVVLTVVRTKSINYWDVTACSVVDGYLRNLLPPSSGYESDSSSLKMDTAGSSETTVPCAKPYSVTS
jgi:hypothetical protein